MAVGAGAYHSLALKSNGIVVAWGAGAIGNPGVADYGQSIVPPGLSNVTAVSAGFLHNLALKADGTVMAWGDNYDEEGHFVGQSVVPGGLANIVAIAAGYYHSLAAKSDGTT